MVKSEYLPSEQEELKNVHSRHFYSFYTWGSNQFNKIRRKKSVWKLKSKIVFIHREHGYWFLKKSMGIKKCY
jgi:hypothetical protein